MKLATEQFGYEFTSGAIRQIGRCVIIGFVLIIAINFVLDRLDWRAFDATDDAAHHERSGLRIYTDHGTGCQYLATSSGNLIQRSGPDGKPICWAPAS